MARRKYRCDLYTPSARIASSEVVHVQFPATDGNVGVLGGRSPMVAMLGVGQITLVAPDYSESEFFVSRGFCRMSGEVLTVLAEECMPVAKLNADEAWEELKSARRLPEQNSRERAIREALVETARGKFNAAQRYRRKQGLVSEPLYEE